MALSRTRSVFPYEERAGLECVFVNRSNRQSSQRRTGPDRIKLKGAVLWDSDEHGCIDNLYTFSMM
jgi:hypothetical protein